MAVNDEDRDAIYGSFNEAVNMTPAAIEKWLDTDESKSVGQKDNGSESIGHRSGKRIVEIKRSKKADLSDGDYEHMAKVVSYVARHSKQRPKGDLAETPWRYSLMNWGHDPLKS